MVTTNNNVSCSETKCNQDPRGFPMGPWVCQPRAFLQGCQDARMRVCRGVPALQIPLPAKARFRAQDCARIAHAHIVAVPLVRTSMRSTQPSGITMLWIAVALTVFPSHSFSMFQPRFFQSHFKAPCTVDVAKPRSFSLPAVASLR